MVGTCLISPSEHKLAVKRWMKSIKHQVVSEHKVHLCRMVSALVAGSVGARFESRSIDVEVCSGSEIELSCRSRYN